MTKLSDCYQTPQGLFDLIDKEFNFIIDACAIEDNVKTRNRNYFDDATKEWKEQYIDMLGQYPEDSECSVFMNPPYSNSGPFLEQAWEFSKYMRVVCLVRDDPSTKWYQNLVHMAYKEGRYGLDHSCTTEYIRKDCFEVDLRQAIKNVEGEMLGIIRLPERLRFEASEEMLENDIQQYPDSINWPEDPCIMSRVDFKISETKNFRRTNDGRIECKNVYNFPCCLMIMDRRGEK